MARATQQTRHPRTHPRRAADANAPTGRRNPAGPPGPQPRVRAVSPPPRRWDEPQSAEQRRAQASAWVVDTRPARSAAPVRPRPWPVGRR